MEQLTVKLWLCLLNLMSFQTLTIDQTKDRLTSAEHKEDILNNVSNAFVHKMSKTSLYPTDFLCILKKSSRNILQNIFSRQVPEAILNHSAPPCFKNIYTPPLLEHVSSVRTDIVAL